LLNQHLCSNNLTGGTLPGPSLLRDTLLSAQLTTTNATAMFERTPTPAPRSATPLPCAQLENRL
jgi:hypothetical protein